MANQPGDPSGPAEPSVPSGASPEGLGGTAREMRDVISEFRKLDLAALAASAQILSQTVGDMATNLEQSVDYVNRAFQTITATSELYNKLILAGEVTNQSKRMESERQKEINELLEWKLQLQQRANEEARKEIGEVTTLWEHMGEKVDKYLSKLRDSRAGVVGLSAVGTIDQAAMSLRNVEALPRQMLGMLPGFEFISLLFQGAIETDKWKTATQTIVQQFDSMGGGAKKYEGTIYGMYKNMLEWNANAAADLSAISRSFADGGVTVDKAWGPGGVGGSLGKLGSNLVEITYKFDNMMEVAAGTGAKLVATGYREFGNTLRESTEFIVNYGLAAQSAGQNTMVFLGAVMQNAQAMKLYHIHLSDVADQQLKLIKYNQEQLGGGKDMAGFAGVIAAAGQQQFMQGITNMSAGYAAIIGQQVLGRREMTGTRQALGEYGQDPIGIMLSFQRGFREAGTSSREFLGTTISEIVAQAREAAGGSASKTEFYLPNPICCR